MNILAQIEHYFEQCYMLPTIESTHPTDSDRWKRYPATTGTTFSSLAHVGQATSVEQVDISIN